VVEYYPLVPDTHAGRIANGFSAAAASAVIRPDGSYSLVVLPGPGVVCVAASPRGVYAAALLEDKEGAGRFHPGSAASGGPGLEIKVGAEGRTTSLRVEKYCALSLIDPDEGAASLALDFTLQPARPVQGLVVGPDGTPLTGVMVVGLTALPNEEMLDSASFTVTGLNPQRGRELFFHHREKGLGKVLTLRGDEAGPLTVRLDPCGSVTGRIVGRGGQPVPGVFLAFYRSGRSTDVMAKTDLDGRFCAALPPGDGYSLRLPFGPRRLLREVGEMEVEPGRSKDLGDFPLAD
jgi:hypothetical protein